MDESVKAANSIKELELELKASSQDGESERRSQSQSVSGSHSQPHSRLSGPHSQSQGSGIDSKPQSRLSGVQTARGKICPHTYIKDIIFIHSDLHLEITFSYIKVSKSNINF